MVCARCGEPLGIGRARRVADGTRRRGQGGRSALVLPSRWRLWLLLGGLLAASAVLASLPERPTRPPQRPGAELMRGVVQLPPADPAGSGDVAIR
jgi:hypothetical protein